MPKRWASTASSCTARTATSSTSSSGKAPTSAATASAGSLEKRTNFAADVTRAVRKEVGEDYPILLRFSQWKQQDFTARLATSPAELERFLRPLVDAGVDCFHCSTRRFWEPEFPEEGSDMKPRRLDEEAVRQTDGDGGLGEPERRFHHRLSFGRVPRRPASTGCSR